MKPSRVFMVLALLILFPLTAQGAPVGNVTHVTDRVDITSSGEAAQPANNVLYLAENTPAPSEEEGESEEEAEEEETAEEAPAEETPAGEVTLKGYTTPGYEGFEELEGGDLLGDTAFQQGIETDTDAPSGFSDIPQESQPDTADTTPPLLSIISKPDSITNLFSASFSFEANETVTFSYRLDGGTWIPTDPSLSLPDLLEADHLIEVRATDASGNQSQIAGYQWTTDYTAPLISIANEPASITNSSGADFSVSADETVTYSYLLDDDEQGSTIFNALGEGEHTLTVTATDQAGNPSTETYTWETDYTPPVITLAASPDPEDGTGTTISASFTNDEPGTVTYSFDGDEPATSVSGLSEGEHSLTVTATDQAGNQSTETWEFDLNRYTLEGSVSGTGSVITGTASGDVSAVAGDSWGGWLINLSGSYTGEHSLSWEMTAGGQTSGSSNDSNGYWLRTINGTDEEGTSNFTFLTDATWGEGTGTVTANFYSDDQTWDAIDSGRGALTETPLAFSASLNSVYLSSGQFEENDSIAGLMGGTDDLWGDNLGLSKDVTLMGESSINPPLWALNIEGSSNLADGGSFLGLLNFSSKDNELTGDVVGLYIKDGSAGYLSLSDLSGTVYSGIGMWDADGYLSADFKNITTVSPGDLSWDSIDLTKSSFSGGITDDDFLDGDIIGESYGISDQDPSWGIFRSVAGGNTDTEGDSYWIASGIGRYDTANIFTGNTYGYYLTETDLGSFAGEISSSDPDGNWTITDPVTDVKDLAFSGYSEGVLLYNDWGDINLAGFTGFEIDSGLIGGLTSPWDDPADFMAMGEYFEFGGYGGCLWSSWINGEDTTDIEDRGYFEGFTSAIWKDGIMEGAARGIYVSTPDPENTNLSTAGILAGDLSGNYYEMWEDWESWGMWMAQGTLVPEEMATGLVAATVNINYDDLHAYLGGHFISDGSIRGVIYGEDEWGGTCFLESLGTSLPWGVYDLMLGNGNYFEGKPWGETEWSATIGGYGFFDNDGEGYWLANIGSAWSADGKITGQLSGRYLTETQMGSIQGPFFGLYDELSVGDGTWIGESIGTFEGDPLAFSGSLGSANWSASSITPGLMGGTTDIWNSGSSSDVMFMGTSSQSNCMTLWAQNIAGYGIVSDEVAFLGFLAFSNVDDVLTGNAVGLYINGNDTVDNNDAGYLTSSDLSGFAGVGISMLQGSDAMSEESKGTTAVTADSFTTLANSSSFIGTVNDTTYPGNIMGESYWVDVANNSWGIFNSLAGGGTEADGFYWIASGIGTYDTGVYDGDIYGYYLDPDNIGAYSGAISSNDLGATWTISLAEPPDTTPAFVGRINGEYPGYDGFINGLIAGTSPFADLGSNSFLALGDYQEPATQTGWTGMIGAQGLFDTNEQGYWIADITNGTWDADTFDGDLSNGLYITNKRMGSSGDITGTLSGVYYDDIGYWKADTFTPVISSTGTDLKFSGIWGVSTGHEHGRIGLTDSDDGSVYEFLAMGEYTDEEGLGGPYIWASNIYAEGEGEDGGFVGGFTGGIWKDGNMDGMAVALYVNNQNEAGILTGDLLGSYYDGIGMWLAEGIFTPIAMAKDLTPEGFDISDINFEGYGKNNGGELSVVASTGKSLSIAGQWGIWKSMLGGTGGYDGVESDWTLHLSDVTEIHRWAEVEGSQSADGDITADVAGAWVNLTDAITGVMGGELKGTFNPTEETWQAVAAGSWMETRMFLGMAAAELKDDLGNPVFLADDGNYVDENGDPVVGNVNAIPLNLDQIAMLNQLNIPCIEVGRTNLSGSENGLSVNMNDVTFFAYSTGDSPKVWATGDVNGSYSAVPIPNTTSVNLTGAGFDGVGVDFGITNWNEVAGGAWGASVDGSGVVSGHAIDITGAAAGTVTKVLVDTTDGTFDGTAAGVATPQ